MEKNLIEVTFTNSTKKNRWSSPFFEKVIKETADYLDLKGNFSTGVHIVGENRIKSLNKKYRNKDKTTDVLSFPIGQGSGKCGIIDLGDIFISIPIAIQDAKKRRVKIENHLAALSVHGFLHLLGYDHEKSRKEKEKMLNLQDKILNSFKIGE